MTDIEISNRKRHEEYKDKSGLAVCWMIATGISALIIVWYALAPTSDSSEFERDIGWLIAIAMVCGFFCALIVWSGNWIMMELTKPPADDEKV